MPYLKIYQTCSRVLFDENECMDTLYVLVGIGVRMRIDLCDYLTVWNELRKSKDCLR